MTSWTVTMWLIKCLGAKWTKRPRLLLLARMPARKCRCARNTPATASIATLIQENPPILSGPSATATPTKPGRAGTPPILNKATPENHVTPPRNQDLPEARAPAKAAAARKAWAMNEAKIGLKTTKWILATKKGSILHMFRLMLTRARYCNPMAIWTVTATTRGTSDPLSFRPRGQRLGAQLTRAKTQGRGRLDTTHCDSVQRQAWCLKARGNPWMAESQSRSWPNLKSHWSNRIIIRLKTFSDRCSRTKKYCWATLGSSRDHRNNRNVMRIQMLDTITTTA